MRRSDKPLAKLEPLLIGRLSRIVFGFGAFVLIWIIGVDSLGPIGTGALVFLGASFFIGGLMTNPGCEITAIPNLFRSEEKRVHCL